MGTPGYMLDLATNERHTFQFNPAELLEGLKMGANYAVKSPHGSSHPRAFYTSSKGRTFTLALIFIRTRTDGTDVEEWRKKIEALPFPDYDSAGRLSKGPHPVRLGFGTWRTLRCRVDDVEPAFGPFHDPETLLPGELRVKITFTEQPEGGDVGFADVRGGA